MEKKKYFARKQLIFFRKIWQKGMNGIEIKKNYCLLKISISSIAEKGERG